MMDQENSIRLAKRVMDQVQCSRREAEIYIEGGYVQVDGVTVEEPGARVTAEQAVALAPDASLLEIRPVTIIVNKPAGVNAGIGSEGLPVLSCVREDTRVESVRGERFLKRHVKNLAMEPWLDTQATGLVVLTQEFGVSRRLQEGLEQEIIVEVKGSIIDNGLALLNHGLSFNGKPLAPLKASWQNEHRLRFAVKAPKPGQIAHMCRAVGLEVVSMKRIRIGRIAMSSLPLGQWRYLKPSERF
ncbi:rRNA pseudouridine synthase [Pseudoduganella ginsengisoli]|uniref:Dual-specificity RNA pseudouridine synthase RluF n=1 Tax=Pseudoduganella ginsengisoli TaxID=1462440 RepID=A0A6L6PYU0_9BURK|nr:RNA pseudouridine synthase [Pseudoduganella ginsengisoli]MTW02148.1 RNA-binding protein [Pseudoduganella ginsengisoli]